MPVPDRPKIYHIVHVDRLASVIADGFLWSDYEMNQRQRGGTTIGMDNIKVRRLNELSLNCYPDLNVGHCTPFYFCSRSVMLYMIYKRNAELAYQGGQEPIVHLESDLHTAIEWAEQKDRRWAFTTSNAGARYFDDYSDLEQLDEINWNAVQARQWSGNLKEGKQAEFLIEQSFPWHLVERIGVHSDKIGARVMKAFGNARHRPPVEVKSDWYY